MKLNKLYFILLLILSISCGDKKTIFKNEFEIVTIENNRSKLSEFTSLVSLFDYKDTTVVMYPLTLNRIDKENGTIQMDYLSNKQVNYEKINPIQRDFKKYFENLNDSIFTSRGNISFNLDNYYSLPNCFVFSNDISNTTENNKIKLYTDIKKMHDDIANYLSTHKEKIYIIYNPTLTNTTTTIEPPKPVVAEATTASASTVVTSTKVVKETTTTTKPIAGSPCPNKITCSGLDDCFKKLADANIPRDCKSGLKSQTVNYFESASSKVVNVNNNGDRIAGEWSISSYCDRLMTTHRPTFVYGKESNGSKISVLKINP